MKRWSLYLYVILASCVFLSAGCGKRAAIPDEALSSQPPVQAGTTDTASSTDAYETGPAADEEAPDTGISGAQSYLDTVYFDFDSWILGREARETIRRNFEKLEANPAGKVLIEGHTDERGSDAYNLALGDKRAKSVMNYLLNLGLDRERVSVISYGEERPADAGHNEEAWAKNRRAEFMVE